VRIPSEPAGTEPEKTTCAPRSVVTHNVAVPCPRPAPAATGEGERENEDERAFHFTAFEPNGACSRRAYE